MTDQLLPTVVFSDAIREEFPAHKQYDYRPYVKVFSMTRYSTPDGAVRSVVHALESRRPWRKYYVTWDAWLMAVITWIAPEAVIDTAYQLMLRPTLPVE